MLFDNARTSNDKIRIVSNSPQQGYTIILHLLVRGVHTKIHDREIQDSLFKTCVVDLFYTLRKVRFLM